MRTDADAHDRLLALTSHLPHALANLLMLRVAEAAADDDAPFAFAGASLREMTRLAGANAPVWSDIFLGNADEIAAALGGLRASLDELEAALRAGDRDRIEATIATAAAARERLESFAYQTAPAQLNRIRIRVPDRPGVLARITQILGAAQINLEDFELRHVSPEYGGVLVILVAGSRQRRTCPRAAPPRGVRRRLSTAGRSHPYGSVTSDAASFLRPAHSGDEDARVRKRWLPPAVSPRRRSGREGYSAA